MNNLKTPLLDRIRVALRSQKRTTFSKFKPQPQVEAEENAILLEILELHEMRKSILQDGREPTGAYANPEKFVLDRISGKSSSQSFSPSFSPVFSPSSPQVPAVPAEDSRNPEREESDGSQGATGTFINIFHDSSPEIDTENTAVICYETIPESPDQNYLNLVKQKTNEFTEAVKKSKLDSEKRKFAIELFNKQFQTVSIPKPWMDGLKKNGYEDSEGAYRLCSHLYKTISRNGFEFTNIQANVMEDFTRDYLKVLNILENLPDKSKKLYINHHYCSGNETTRAFTKSYRCFKSNDLELVNLVIRKTKKNKDLLSMGDVKLGNELTEYAETQLKEFDELKIDIINALEYCNPTRKDFYSVQKTIKIIQIFKENYSMSSPDKNRIYHSFNMLDSDLRQFVKTKKTNQSFVKLDIVAAQPSILMSLFEKPSDDTLKLIEIFKKERIYDYLARELNSDPEKIKTNYMTFLYDPFCNNKVLNYFKDKFPGFLNDFTKLKNKQPGKDFWNALAGRETEIIKTVFFKSKGIRITIHDEIMILPEYYEETKILFTEVLNSFKIPSRVK